MRRGLVALLVVTLGCHGALAEDEGGEAADPWLGCWERVYDSAHLDKHPGQLVTALTLSIIERDSDEDKYLAEITAKMRKSAETYSNREGARCRLAGSRLACISDGFFAGRFKLELAGENAKLVIGESDYLTLVPVVDTNALIVLSPKTPEHTLFVLKPIACG
jgi:hypothetical protein